MKSLLKKFNLMVLALILFGCSEDLLPVELGSIVGKVTDATSAEPLKGVLVSISPTGKSIITGSDGKFEFIEIEDGQYTISVSKDNYNSDSKIVNVQSGIITADFSIITGNGSVSLSTDILDFGTANDVLNFDIENIGRSSFTYTVESNLYDWLSISPKSATIEAGRKKSVTITIDRTKIDEDKNITLPISSNAGSDNINIKVEHIIAAAEIELSKTELDFGESTTTLNFDVTNTGNAELNFEITNNEDWITFSPSPLNVPANGQRVISATIDRSKITSTKDIDFAYASNAGSGSIKVKVGYIAPSAEIALSKSELDFGESTTTLNFDVTNTGNAELNFEITNNEDWITFSPSPLNVPANGQRVISATIDRSKITSTKDIDFAYASNAGSGSIKVKVGYIAPSAEIALSKSKLDFGENLTYLSFDIENDGNADLTYNISTGSERWLSVSPANSTISGGGVKTVTVTVNRENLTSSKQYTLVITSNAGSKEILIKVTKPIPAGVLDVSVTSLAFGENLDQLTFTVSNTGTAALNFRLLGNYPWLSGHPVNGVVEPSSSMTITIYVDRDKVFGDESGTLTVQTTDGQEHRIAVTVYEPINYGTVVSPFQDISVVITDVYMVGADFYLDFKATYTGGTVASEFRLYGRYTSSTSSSDNEGNIYNDYSVSLGGSSYSIYNESILNVQPNTVMKGSVKIANIDINATKFSSITLKAYLTGSSSQNIVFKNVPIIR